MDTKFMTTPDVIIQFWLHSLTDATPIDKKSPPAKLWFNGGKAFDEEIRQKFEGVWREAKGGGLKDWEATARGRLALVLIFDQFSRNMFRGAPQAFETDALALELTERSIKDGQDKELMCVERVFLFMPFMHSEVLGMQEEGVRRFEYLVEESKVKSPHNTFYFEYNLKYSRQHRDIIARFGRFPHRNAVLGRISTSEEKEFLSKSGSTF